jgi:hypothetical protein
MANGNDDNDEGDAYKQQARVENCTPVWSKTSGPLSPSSLDFTQAFRHGDATIAIAIPTVTANIVLCGPVKDD